MPDLAAVFWLGGFGLGGGLIDDFGGHVGTVLQFILDQTNSKTITIPKRSQDDHKTNPKVFQKYSGGELCRTLNFRGKYSRALQLKFRMAEEFWSLFRGLF